MSVEVRSGTVLRLRSPDWASPPVVLAVGSYRRLRGLRPRPEGMGLLLWGRSIHSRGMTESLTVCALDERGVVTAIRRLAPERVVSFPTTGWLLEVPTRSLAPAVGSELTVVLPKQTESTPSAPL